MFFRRLCSLNGLKAGCFSGLSLSLFFSLLSPTELDEGKKNSADAEEP